MRRNAEVYNGLESHIAQIGKNIEQHAVEMLNQVINDIENLEMLVNEKK